MIKGQDIEAAQKFSDALGVALGATATAVGNAPLVAEALLRHLHRKLHGYYVAKRRSRNTMGLVLNLLTGGDPACVEMSAHHMRQTLGLLGIDANGTQEAHQTYLLRRDVARAAHDVLGAQLGVAPDVLHKGLN